MATAKKPHELAKEEAKAERDKNWGGDKKNKNWADFSAEDHFACYKMLSAQYKE